MGNCRFLYQNLLTSTMLNCNTAHQKKGIVTAPYKEGQGSGGLICVGAYDHYEDLEYVVEIDGTGGGNEKGQAEFRWRDGTAWDASTLLIPEGTVALTHGAVIQFTSGVGDDFYLGDIWYFKGINLFKPGNMVDGDPNTKWMSATGSTYYDIFIDLGGLSSVNAVVLSNHNIASGSSIYWGACDSSNYSTYINTTIMTWNSGVMVHYWASMTTAQYWKLSIHGASNINLEIGEMFLGRYYEPADNFSVDSDNPVNVITDIRYTPAGSRKDIYHNNKRTFSLSFPYMTTTDKDNFETMIDYLGDSTTQKYKPMFFNMDSTNTNKSWLVKVNGGIGVTQHKARFSLNMNLEEVI